MLWLGSYSTAVVMGYCLSSLLVTGSQLYFLRRRFRPQGEKTKASAVWGRQILAFSWPFTTWGLFTWAQQVSDRWALQTFASTKDVGLYAVVFQLGYAPIGLATGLAMTFLAPILYQRSGSATDQTRNTFVHSITWRITFADLLITVMAFVFTFLLHGWIFHVLVAAKYHSVSYLLPWMILAGGLFAAGQMLSLKLMSEMKPSSLIAAKIMTAILGVGSNIYGASRFGIQGVVAALVGFSGIYFVWMAWVAQHSTRAPSRLTPFGDGGVSRGNGCIPTSRNS